MEEENKEELIASTDRDFSTGKEVETKEVETKQNETSKQQVKNEETYPNPPKTLAEAKERVGDNVELDAYGLVKEPRYPGDYSEITCIIFGIVSAILLNVFFYGQVLGAIIDAVVLGVVGFFVGGFIGWLFGAYVCTLFVSKKQKEEYRQKVVECKKLNKKYNLVRIEPVAASNELLRCPECGGHVIIVDRANRAGDIGIGDSPAYRTKTTYKCKSCGFSYYSIEMTTTEHKDFTTFTGDYEKHTIVTESLQYKTDGNCSIKASVILKNSGYKRVVDKTAEAKKEIKETRRKIKSGDDW